MIALNSLYCGLEKASSVCDLFHVERQKQLFNDDLPLLHATHTSDWLSDTINILTIVKNSSQLGSFGTYCTKHFMCLSERY